MHDSSTSVFPDLKRHIGLKHESDYDWVADCHLGGAIQASTREIFVLSLCAGLYSLADIAHIYAGTFALDRETAEAEVHEITAKYADCLEMPSKPVRDWLRYDPLRFLQPPAEVQHLWRLGHESPMWLVFSLSHACNYRCIHCVNDSGEKRSQELALEDWLRVVDQAADLQVMRITLSGGEPTLYPGFLAIVERMVEHGIYPFISTNGSQLTPEGVRQLAELGVGFVHLSLSAATEPLYDAIVGRRGHLATVRQAIASLKEHDFYVRVKMVVMPPNLGDVGPLLDLCHTLDVDFVHLCPFHLTHLARGGNRFLLSPEQFQELDAVVQEKAARYGDEMVFSSPPPVVRWEGPSAIARCGGFSSQAVILPNGDVTLCETLIDLPEFVVGNIRQNSLQELWRSEGVYRLSAVPQERLEEPCVSCEYLEGCKTGCFSSSLLCSDNPWAVDPRCWKANVPDNPFDLRAERAVPDELALSAQIG